MAARAQSRDRTLVVGAGIVGICCALYLQREGISVTVVDPREPGDGCSFGNAGVLSTGGVTPEAMPGILRRVPRMLLDPLGPIAIRWSYLPRIAPWLLSYAWNSRAEKVEQISIALAQLSKEVIPAYEPLLGDAGLRDMVRKSGCLYVYESEEAFRSARPAIELRRRRGIPAEELPGEEIRQLEPDLAPIFPRAVFWPGFAHTLNPKRLTSALAEHFARRGGSIFRGEVVALERTGEEKLVAVTRGERLEAARIVVAAGAWSRPLAAMLGTRLPLDTERGYHVMLPQPGVTLRRPVLSSEGGFVMTPMEHGLRLAGTVELGGLKAPPDPKRADAILKRARRMLPGLGEAGSETWMGFRPSFPDSLPVIDRAPHQRNAYFAFGHGHRGLSFAAITGKLIAELVRGGKTSIDVAPYRAARF